MPCTGRVLCGGVRGVLAMQWIRLQQSTVNKAATIPLDVLAGNRHTTCTKALPCEKKDADEPQSRRDRSDRIVRTTIDGSGRERNSCLLPLMICLVPHVTSNTGGTKCGEASIIWLCTPGIWGEVRKLYTSFVFTWHVHFAATCRAGPT